MRSNTSLTRAAIGLVALGVGVAGLTGCGGRQDTATTDTGGEVTCNVEQPTRVAIATGNATGVYFALGNAFAPLVGDSTGGKLTATAAETGASVQNIQSVVNGEYQVAFTLADSAADAVQGTGPFNGAKQPIQALSRIHTNFTQVVVRKDSGIKSVADMKGKRVSTGSPNSGTEVIAHRLLTAAGLDYEKDLPGGGQKLDLTKTVDGMKDGAIDALFWSGGLPTPGINQLFTEAKGEVEFIDITPLLPELKKINPVYEDGVIPAATYGAEADTNTIVVPNLLVVRDNLDANVACALTKALFDQKPKLEAVNASAKGITLDTARKTAPVPLHRGAVKALDDLGAAQ